MTNLFTNFGSFIFKLKKIIIILIFFLFTFSFYQCGSDTIKTTINSTSIKDTDKDGIEDKNDNCPLVTNTDQLDTDSDGTGDVCQDDKDGDGVLDEVDNCPLIANQDQADGDGDGIGNFCDIDYISGLTEDFADFLLEDVVQGMINGIYKNEVNSYGGDKSKIKEYYKNLTFDKKDFDIVYCDENSACVAITIPLTNDEIESITDYQTEAEGYLGNELLILRKSDLDLSPIRDSIHQAIMEYDGF